MTKELHHRRCDNCHYFGATTAVEGICGHPVYKRGKMIYRDTKSVIAHVGCVSQENKHG